MFGHPVSYTTQKHVLRLTFNLNRDQLMKLLLGFFFSLSYKLFSLVNKAIYNEGNFI